MKLETIKERINNTTEKIAKKENTIIKKEVLIEKKNKKLQQLDATVDSEARWLSCEIDYLREDIERGQKEVKELKINLEKYNELHSNEIKKDSIVIKEIPEVIKQLQTDLVNNWDAWDIKRRNKIKEDYYKISHSEFIKKYSATDYALKDKTKKQIHENNMQLAKDLILDLYNRVKKITGEITDWSNIYVTQGVCGSLALNGYVLGKDGRANVESIVAGGYNVQRLHIRVLVK